jgi:hypothetical protein
MNHLRKIAVFILFLPMVLQAQPYELVVYNAENIFDADGMSAYDDYKTPGYTPRHVLTKVRNVAAVMARYNGGKGADVIIFNEFEADQSQSDWNTMSAADFLLRWEGISLESMLTTGFGPVTADIPSEFLVLKAMAEAGMTGYEVVTGYAPLGPDGKPTHAIKNVVFSRLPVMYDRTRRHEVEDARPILEVWLDVDGHRLAVFANHWKSGAGNPQMERARIQNATVLKARLDELRAENPRVDFILGGDFNSDYNQSQRYGSTMPVTGVNTVLRSTGNEMKVAAGTILPNDWVYNLWYELPVDQRRSDQFRGFWGTLMQIMIGPGMYDRSGVHYVDNSFALGKWPGFNAYTTSGMPIRWSAFGDGYGYADHFPLSMRFDTAAVSDTVTIRMEYPSKENGPDWAPLPVTYRMPEPGEYLEAAGVSGPLRTAAHFDRLFRVDAEVLADNRVRVNGEDYELFSPSFRVQDRFKERIGQTVSFYGRLGQFRGRWQFVIDSEAYIR